MNIIAILILLVFATTAQAAGQQGITSYAATPASADTVTLFAFDDHSIPFQRNLQLTMHPPKKHPGSPVVRHGAKGAPDEYRAQFYGSVVQHAGKYKMWYLAANPQSIESLRRRPASFADWNVCYAESDDGIRWTKPDLGLVEFRGSKNNNIVQLAPYQPGCGNVLVIHEPQDPDPTRRFKMMLLLFADNAAGQRVCNNILPFFSADGLRWRQAVPTEVKDGILTAAQMQLAGESFEMGGLYRFQNTYFVTGQQVSPYTWLPDGAVCGRVMSIFRSHDFQHWSDTKSQGFIRWGYRSAPANQGEESHMPAATWNRGNVLLGVYGQFHGSPSSGRHPLDLGLLLSNDGIHFREPQPDYVFLPYEKDSPWQSHGLVQGQGFLNVGDETYIYFSGWDGDVTTTDVHAEIGLATMRRDGFGSVSPKLPGRPASFITCLLEAQTKARLWVNAAGLSAQSRLNIELLDEAEKPLAGYSGAEMAVVEHSGTRVAVRWKNSDSLDTPHTPFRCRVTFDGEQSREARLYAVYVGR